MDDSTRTTTITKSVSPMVTLYYIHDYMIPFDNDDGARHYLKKNFRIKNVIFV